MFPAEMLDRLSAVELQTHLSCTLIGRQIVVLEQTGSTNDAVLELATSPSEGVVLFAEHQTAGRGQRGNRWNRPREGSFTLLRPQIQINESCAYGLAIEAISDVIRAGCARFDIKMPNDVQLTGAKWPACS